MYVRENKIIQMKVRSNSVEVTLSAKECDYYGYIFAKVASDDGEAKVRSSAKSRL